jgi:hypothetical protein
MAPAGGAADTCPVLQAPDLVQDIGPNALTATRSRARLLIGRGAELESLYSLVDRTAERSGTIVVRGEPGSGKTSLLRAASRHASENGVLVLSTVGVQSEACLACSGLQRLFIPVLAGLDRLPPVGHIATPTLPGFDRCAADRLGRLPTPQREALETAFGLTEREPPDRYLLGLAVLGLLADVAAERPLLCIIDDVQWLDAASTQALAFAARRLSSQSVAIVFAVREPSDNRDVIGLPQLPVAGLQDEDARALLSKVIPGRLDGRVRDRILAETRRNPRALLETARNLSPAELAGGLALPNAGHLPLPGEPQCLQRVAELPDEVRRLMLLVAADPLGDAALILRAAQTLKIDPGTLVRGRGRAAAGDRGLHPLPLSPRAGGGVPHGHGARASRRARRTVEGK